MFVLALDAQLIEAKRSGKLRPTWGVRSWRLIRSWLQNINHQTVNAPWGLQSNEDTRNDWPHPLHRSETVVG
ncbi:hypothetical protein ACVC7V_17120 [Hydrogenophaga sp. A37]|uniref:hypothetical protein n=1 Tax=Hydrogenophaga sp. A37 TaxID=1945864 RepID=UPI00117AD046|nr:hypothetical protein [Hydrogenophaga sp. A37]